MAAPMVRIHNRMLRARILKLQGNEGCKGEEQAAFQLLRDGLLEAVAGKKNYPKLNVYSDQIVWGRSRCALTLQEDGQIHLLTLSIREEV